MASQRLTDPASTGRILHSDPVPPQPLSQAKARPDLMPVLRPRLPSAAEILPYLEAIDERRWYSNIGPLVTRLEQELSHRLGEGCNVITTANATLGLTAALLARRLPVGSICLMPSWTFAATPHAARAAGLTVWFHDVDRRTWALNPDHVMETLKSMRRSVSSVIVVEPFGAPVDMKGWEEFQDRTGIAVIIDAAAAFDAARASRIPVVVSLHATKILGAGEGGFIASTDSHFAERARACCNFGFQGSRSAMLPALNSKMSEYHAAVALASLAAWPAIRLRHAQIMEWYRRAIFSLEKTSLQPGYGNGWVSSTTSVLLPARSRDKVLQHLTRCGIETRQWWGQGCHVQPAFMDCPRSALAVTEELGGRVLGLPHFPDMLSQHVDAVAGALSGALLVQPQARRRIA
jgi:dTDP-4-amino-4,6-dideoxygalactose transaminase